MKLSQDMTFDHMGIACRSMEIGRRFFRGILNISNWTEEIADPINQVYVQFGYHEPNICYEIIAPFGDTSPIWAALNAKSRILNHVAYLVDDLEAKREYFRTQRCVAAGPPSPAVAYGNKRIQFFVTPLGFLIELIEAPGHKHLFVSSTGM